MKVEKDANVVFDAGANVGVYSLAALLGNPIAKIEDFETTPEISEPLIETSSLNNLTSLRVHEIAVSDNVKNASLSRLVRYK